MEKLNTRSTSDFSCQVIALAGGSGSGKTTLAQSLVEFFTEEKCATLPQDAYYRSFGEKWSAQERAGFNFDHPDAIDFHQLAVDLRGIRHGQSIDRPVYDFSLHKRREEKVRVEAKPIVLVDGMLLLTQDHLRSLFDIVIFVDTPETVRLERRIERDIRLRGRSVESVRTQFHTQVKPMHDLFVEPSKQFAQYLVDGRRDFSKVIEELESHGAFQSEFRHS